MRRRICISPFIESSRCDWIFFSGTCVEYFFWFSFHLHAIYWCCMSISVFCLRVEHATASQQSCNIACNSCFLSNSWAIKKLIPVWLPERSETCPQAKGNHCNRAATERPPSKEATPLQQSCNRATAATELQQSVPQQEATPLQQSCNRAIWAKREASRTGLRP